MSTGRPTTPYRRVERHDRARPNYAARRLGAAAVAVIAAFLVAYALHAVVVSFGGDPAFAAVASPSAASAEAPAADRVHVARSGDSLWSIADDHRGDVGRDRYVRALIELNDSTTVIVGQAVRLP
jgi:Tfp pilus assembly protein FimV